MAERPTAAHGGTAARHTHAHVYLGDAHDAHERRTRAAVLLTAVMMVLEIVAGWATGSMALLADGMHMATHAGALGAAAFAYRFARKHADDRRFTFGTGKVGDLAGFASALALGMVALGIAVTSAERLLTPTAIAYDEALWIAGLGLVVNLATAWMLRGDDHHGHGHDHASGHGHAHGDAHADNNLRSAYYHVLADALTSVLAIGALLAGRQLGWGWMDPAMGIVGALVIARWSWGLLRDTGAVLVDAAANPALEAEIREAIEDGDAVITDLHLWRVGPGRYAAMVSLVADAPLSPTVYADRIRIHEELVHVTIEPHRCAGTHEGARTA